MVVYLSERGFATETEEGRIRKTITLVKELCGSLNFCRLIASNIRYSAGGKVPSFKVAT